MYKTIFNLYTITKQSICITLNVYTENLAHSIVIFIYIIIYCPAYNPAVRVENKFVQCLINVMKKKKKKNW